MAAVLVLTLLPPPGPSLLLIVVDTLRADRLGTYGYHLPTSPVLDRLAGESLVFETAISPAPFTMPAMAGLMTGLYPDRTGVINHSPQDRIHDSVATLAELARRRGYRTSAVVSNPWLVRAQSGFGRGFDTFISKHSLGLGEGKFDAKQVTDQALALMGKPSKSPFFLWVHYLDTHMPYQPPPQFASLFGDGRTSSRVVEDFSLGRDHKQAIYFGARGYRQSELQRTRDLYDASVRFVDTQIGRLLEALDTGSRKVLVVVTADHGESLGDHGLFFAHDFTLYEELLHVPLILRHPTVGPQRISTPVSLLDVFATLCLEMDLDCRHPLDGQPLPGLRAGPARPQRTLFATSAPARARYSGYTGLSVAGPAGRWSMLRQGHTKVIRIPTPAGPTWQAYHLIDDPGETHNLYLPSGYAAETGAVEDWIEAMSRARPYPAGGKNVDPETLAELRSLGYLDISEPRQ